MAASAAVPPLPTTSLTSPSSSLPSLVLPPPAPLPLPSSIGLDSVVEHATQFAVVAAPRAASPVPAEEVDVRDRSYLGAYGATLLLTRLRSETHTLLADDNQLHDLGVYALIAGLARRRDRPVTSSWEDWEGLRRISLGGNDIGDKGTIALLRDASRQGGELETLMSLGLQHNRIKLRERTAEEIVGYLNASRLIELNFASNPLNPRGIVKFFEGLTAPIQAIDLCDCDLTEAVVPALVGYLTSTLSRSLSHLDLSFNQLGEDGVIAIVQAVERRNFTITTLDLEGNASVEDMGGEFEYLDLWNDTDLGGGGVAPEGLSDAEKAFHARVRRHSAHWNTVLDRNRALRRRLEDAGRRVLGPARILLLGRPAPAVSTSDAFSNSQHWRLKDTSAVSSLPAILGTRTRVSPVARPFPILHLPREVVSMIARHCSGDADAFSDVQWARVVRHIEQRDTIGSMAARVAKHTREDGCFDDKGRAEVLALWRGDVGCEHWDG